jgi:hypothetical protein
LYKNYTTSNNGSNTYLSSYVAGLIEGDGTIHVPKTERSNKGNLNYPSIQIVFHLKDLPLALLIQKEIGHGSICRKKGVNAAPPLVKRKGGGTKVGLDKIIIVYKLLRLLTISRVKFKLYLLMV